LRARANDRVIVESTAQMAQALKLLTVAEGVEDEWEAQFLAAAGYDYGQGYHFSPALCTADCADWVSRRNHKAARPTVPARRLASGGRS
jgi:EAL domain-containing protein (putative c-di-GMP-specific phosphodiesterase class I)